MNIRALRTPIAVAPAPEPRRTRGGKSNAELSRELPVMILRELNKSGPMTVPELCAKWGYKGATSVRKHIRALTQRGAVVPTGELRASAAVYREVAA